MIPPAGILPALKKNEIDAVAFVSPALDYDMRFHEAADYYYTGWHSPGAEFQFLVSEKKFATLSPQFQSILIAAMRLSAQSVFTQSYHNNSVKLDKLLKEHPNVKIRAFPRKIFREFTNSINDILDERIANGSTLTSEIIESQRSYIKKARQWTRISDQAYLNNALQ